MTIFLTLLSIYLLVGLIDLGIILHFHGHVQYTRTQKYMQQLWLSDKIYNTYEHISWGYFNTFIPRVWYVIVFLPIFNLIWLVISFYRLYSFYINKY